jgi:transcriptional regulator with XRE-family HTH domain
MQTENLGDFIRQLREQAEMPLRKLAALLDIDQSTLSKLERGERPVSRQMLPIIAKTFKVDEKELVIKFMSKQVAYQLADEKYAKDILIAAEEELSYAKSRTPMKKEKSGEQIKYLTKKNGKK